MKQRTLIIPFVETPIDPAIDLLLNGTHNARAASLKRLKLARTRETWKGKIVRVEGPAKSKK